MITGPIDQVGPVLDYYAKVRDDDAGWLTGISMYQFRDRGRLGLETEDPNNPLVGIRQPLLDEYRKVLADPYYSPNFKSGDETSFPATLRWGGSEDSDGIEIDLQFERTPEFCEVTLPSDLCLMMEFHGRWFYKAPGVTMIDLMSAFFDNPLDGPETIPIRIFATPPDGENHDNGRDDWDKDQYYVMDHAPEFRVRYDVPGGRYVRKNNTF